MAKRKKKTDQRNSTIYWALQKQTHSATELARRYKISRGRVYQISDWYALKRNTRGPVQYP